MRKPRRLLAAMPAVSRPPITVITGGRALLMLIAARFSGSGSGKDLLSRAISLVAFGLLPFSNFPIPILEGFELQHGRAGLFF
jgi:hypothetical protein